MESRKILLVDDEASVRMTLAANLELAGFSVVEAGSGEVALQLAQAQPFDLVLTDIRMPGISGVELFRRLRKQGLHIPIVLMSAFSLEGLIQDALSEGAFTVLAKPFNVDRALELLCRAVRGPIVLVVDDVESVAESTAASLQACGVKAKAVTSGDMALEAIKAGNIDVCVVDMVMPGMTGPELVERLKDLEPAPVVIAVSGHDIPEAVRRVAAAGSYAFIRKPFAARELIRAVANARGTLGR